MKMSCDDPQIVDRSIPDLPLFLKAEDRDLFIGVKEFIGYTRLLELYRLNQEEMETLIHESLDYLERMAISWCSWADKYSKQEAKIRELRGKNKRPYKKPCGT